jgi:hypothetical protein
LIQKNQLTRLATFCGNAALAAVAERRAAEPESNLMLRLRRQTSDMNVSLRKWNFDTVLGEQVPQPIVARQLRWPVGGEVVSQVRAVQFVTLTLNG